MHLLKMQIRYPEVCERCSDGMPFLPSGRHTVLGRFPLDEVVNWLEDDASTSEAGALAREEVRGPSRTTYNIHRIGSLHQGNMKSALIQCRLLQPHPSRSQRSRQRPQHQRLIMQQEQVRVSRPSHERMHAPKSGPHAMGG
jgi:hypothetical protein